MQNQQFPGQLPDVSVVIPTHNRAQSLGRVLDALNNQIADAARFEIVVVDDGSSDDTLAYLASNSRDIRLKVVHQEQSGVAVARNHGAREATAPLLIFIDDDVTPAPGFLQAHLDAQGDNDGCVAIGRLSPSDLEDADPPGWWRWLEWQFDKQFDDMESGVRPVDGEALYSGNFSLPAAMFWHVDGFDESVPWCEDTDLGLRLEQVGATFRLAPDAIGYHSGYRGFDSWRETAYRGGFWDGRQVLKMSRAFSLADLVRSYNERHPALRSFADFALGRRRVFQATIAAMRLGAAAASTLRLRKLERYAYGGIFDLTVWQGVCDGLGDVELLRRYLHAEMTEATT